MQVAEALTPEQCETKDRRESQDQTCSSSTHSKGARKAECRAVRMSPVAKEIPATQVADALTDGGAKKEEAQQPNIDQLAYAVPVKSGRVSGVREVFLPPTGGEEAEGHRCSCDAEALFPGVDVSATKGLNEQVAEEGHVVVPRANASNLNATLEGIVQLFRKKQSLKFFVEQEKLQSSIRETSVTVSSWACCQNYGDNITSGVGASAMLGKSGQVTVEGRIAIWWRVRKRWRERTSEALSKERAEFMKAVRKEQMADAYHHDQVEADWDDEARPFY